jgi:hypothetical protein
MLSSCLPVWGSAATSPTWTPSRIESYLLEETIAAAANALLHPKSEERLADLMRET